MQYTDIPVYCDTPTKSSKKGRESTSGGSSFKGEKRPNRNTCRNVQQRIEEKQRTPHQETQEYEEEVDKDHQDEDQLPVLL